MIETKNRKEVSLDSQTLSILKIQAKKEGRNLKNYMEHVLKNQANTYQLSDDYKLIMDNILLEKEKGTLNFISEEEFRTRSLRK